MKCARTATHLAAVLLVLFSAGARADSNPVSGNEMLGACQRWSSGTFVPDLAEQRQQGMCAGIVSSIFYYGSELPLTVRFCAPKGASQGQALRIVVKYLVDNPAITNRDLRDLALAALHSAWPCPAP
jgi:hypothetical protein